MRAPLRLVILACLTHAACAPTWKSAPHDAFRQRAVPLSPHHLPDSTPTDIEWWEAGYQSLFGPIGRVLSPARWWDWKFGSRESLDTNAFGQVADSSWFVNRVAAASADSILNMPDGPVAGPLVIVKASMGTRPRILVRDGHGTEWVIRVDPPAFPEMSTSAEIIAARLVRAVGYHVPDTHLVSLDVRRLAITEDSKLRDGKGRSHKLTRAKMTDLLKLVNPGPDHKLRTVFVRDLPGTHLGPWLYRGTRESDPGDRLPHERRRSLRGYWVVCAWLNIPDTLLSNTLDTFIDGGRGVGRVRHYLVNFSGALGAGNSTGKSAIEGNEHVVDMGNIGLRIVGAGLIYPYWLTVQRSPYRSIGLFEAKRFRPSSWRPRVPNHAFIEANPQDTAWGASLLARLPPKLIRAAVDAANYTKPEAANYVYKVLIERRKKILGHAFAKVSSLDHPRRHNRYIVTVDDLAIAGNVLKPTKAEYRYDVQWNRTGRRDVNLGGGTTRSLAFDLRPAIQRAMSDNARAFKNDPYLTIAIEHMSGPSKGLVARVHLRAVNDFVIPVALER